MNPTHGMRILTIMVWVCLAVFFFLLYSTVIEAKRFSTENNTYLHTIACISSVSPTERTPQYVRSCYDMAEKGSGKIKRFGDAQLSR